MVKSRELRTERLHLFAPNIYIVMKAIIGGNPSLGLLEEAIAQAVKANEILNCRIWLDEDGMAGYEKINEPVYSVEITDKGWMEVAKEQERIIFHLDEGELIRFFIHTSGEDVQLTIIAHHLAGDGISIVYLMKDIFAAMTGERLEHKPLKLAYVEDFPKGSQLNIITKYLLNRINKKWLREKTVFTYADYEKMYYNYWNNRSTYICCHQLSKSEFKQLHHTSKEIEVSLNSLITTAFIEAYEGCADTGFANSIRENGYHGMGNYASGISIKYKYNKKKDFSKNAQAVHRLIYKKLNNSKRKYFILRFIDMMNPALLASACMTAFGGYKSNVSEYFTHLIGYDGHPKDLSITNLTKLVISEEYGKYKIKDFSFVAPIIPNSCRVIGIATLGDSMCITMHVFEGDNLANTKLLFSKAIGILKEKI